MRDELHIKIQDLCAREMRKKAGANPLCHRVNLSVRLCSTSGNDPPRICLITPREGN